MAIQKPFCVLPLPLSNITTNNARSNRPVTHLGLPQYPGMRWQTNGSTGGVFARGQFGGASGRVNFASLMAANAQPGTQIRLRLGGSEAEVNDAGSYNSLEQTFINPARSRVDGLYHWHFELPSTINATWWRIDITGHTGDFSASALILGEKRTPARFYNRDRELGYEDLGALEISRNGVVSETSGVVLKTMLFRLEWVDEAEFFDNWAPLMQTKGKRQIVYWCFNPESTVRRQDQSFLGFMARDLFMRGGITPTANQVDFQLRAIL